MICSAKWNRAVGTGRVDAFSSNHLLAKHEQMGE